MKEITSKWGKILHGGDYNPDQWPRSVWDEDMKLFREAKIDIASVPIFSWTLLQPGPDRFEFGWLDELFELLEKNGIRICLATSTAAMPAWAARLHPEILRVNEQGVKQTYGLRHNACPNSPVFRKLSAGIAGKLAERYGKRESVVAWHISNEYGGHCFCSICKEAFQAWLKERYGSLDALNAKWGNAFWNHTYTAWDEIELPSLLNERFQWGGRTTFCNQSLELDYWRFMSQSHLACYRAETEAIRPHSEKPITTNFMGAYQAIDYFEWGPHLDIVSWDNYPVKGLPPSEIAFRHELMRGLKEGQSFMLMEQTPSQLNWMPHARLRRPNEMRLWSYQAVARGADTMQYFQLRRSRSGSEKLHGAVIDHAGHGETRVFREVARLGRELESLGDKLLETRDRPEVCILFDWWSYWAFDHGQGPNHEARYADIVRRFFAPFWALGLRVAVRHPDMPLDGFKIVAAPLLYLTRDGFGKKIEAFTAAGGHFIATTFSGLVDENDGIRMGGYPADLRRVLGLRVEETDAAPQAESNRMDFQGAFSALPPCRSHLLFDRLHPEGAEVLAVHGEDFYAGMPALTRNRFGKGRAWYFGTVPDEAGLLAAARLIAEEAGVKPLLEVPPGVEAAQREGKQGRYLFLLNHNAESAEVDLGGIMGEELLGGREARGRIALEGRGVALIERRD